MFCFSWVKIPPWYEHDFWSWNDVGWGNEKNLGTSWTHARTVSGCFLRCFPSGWTAVETAGTRWRDSTRRISGPWTMSFRTRTCFLAAEDFQLSRCCNFISFTSGGFSQRYWFDRHHIYSPFTLALTSVAMVPMSSIIFKESVSEAGERLGATRRQHWTSGRGTAAWCGIQDISVWFSYHPILLRLPDPGPIILHHPLRGSHIVDGLWLLFEVYHMRFWLIFLLAQEHLGPVHRRWSLEQTGDWLKRVSIFGFQRNPQIQSLEALLVSQFIRLHPDFADSAGVISIALQQLLSSILDLSGRVYQRCHLVVMLDSTAWLRGFLSMGPGNDNPYHIWFYGVKAGPSTNVFNSLLMKRTAALKNLSRRSSLPQCQWSMSRPSTWKTSRQGHLVFQLSRLDQNPNVSWDIKMAGKWDVLSTISMCQKLDSPPRFSDGHTTIFSYRNIIYHILSYTRCQECHNTGMTIPHVFPMTIGTTVRVWAWTTAHMDPTTRRSTSIPRVTWAKKWGPVEMILRFLDFAMEDWSRGDLQNVDCWESSRTSPVESNNSCWKQKLMLNIPVAQWVRATQEMIVTWSSECCSGLSCIRSIGTLAFCIDGTSGGVRSSNLEMLKPVWIVLRCSESMRKTLLCNLVCNLGALSPPNLWWPRKLRGVCLVAQTE